MNIPMKCSLHYCIASAKKAARIEMKLSSRQQSFYIYVKWSGNKSKTIYGYFPFD